MDKVLVDDMRNLFLLNVSHSPECVLDQIQNIKKFVSDEEYIVIHISGSTKEQFLKESEEKGIDFFSMEHENVIVNPSSVMTERGVLLTEAFISSFDFAKEKFEFDKVVLNSSNQLYIRRGLKGHLAKHDAGVHRVISSGEGGMYSYQSWARDMDNAEHQFLRDVFQEPRRFYWSFHEGSFFKKQDFELISELFKRHFPKSLVSSEEQTLFSLYNNIFTDSNASQTTVWMNIYCDIQEIDAIDLIRNRRYKELESAVGTAFGHPREAMACGDHIFGIKRVERDINNKTRKYIQTLD